LVKIAFPAIAFIVLTSVIVILWQRQPKNSQVESVKVSQETEQKKDEQELLTITPISGSIVSQTPQKLEGTTSPENIILIYSNNFQKVAKADASGNFETQISLEEGLNLFRIVLLSPPLEKTFEKSFDFYLSTGDAPDTVAAGPVKSIFDSLITVTTSQGDKNVRTSSSTTFEVPEEEDVEEATREVDNIRIGDYAIALGNASDEDSLVAENFTVIRQDKPQLTEQTSVGTIASTLRQNIFSLKNKSGEIIEFSLSPNTSLLNDGSETENDEIVKDKNAIVFYYKEENENLVDLVYLLP
jgi:hypothetical protein